MINKKVTETVKSYLILAFVNLAVLSFMYYLLNSHMLYGRKETFLVCCIIGYLAYIYFFVKKEVKVKTEELYGKVNVAAKPTVIFPIQITNELKLYCVLLKETRMFYDTSWKIVGEHKGELFSVELIRQDGETLESMLVLLKNITEPTDIMELDQRNEIFYD